MGPYGDSLGQQGFTASCSFTATLTRLHVRLVQQQNGEVRDTELRTGGKQLHMPKSH